MSFVDELKGVRSGVDSGPVEESVGGGGPPGEDDAIRAGGESPGPGWEQEPDGNWRNTLHPDMITDELINGKLELPEFMNHHRAKLAHLRSLDDPARRSPGLDDATLGKLRDRHARDLLADPEVSAFIDHTMHERARNIGADPYPVEPLPEDPGFREKYEQMTARLQGGADRGGEELSTRPAENTTYTGGPNHRAMKAHSFTRVTLPDGRSALQMQGGQLPPNPYEIRDTGTRSKDGRRILRLNKN